MKKVLLMITVIMLILSYSLLELQAEETTRGKESVTEYEDPGGYVKKKPADKKGALGAGVILGSPIGPTLKYWLNPRMAINIGLGFENDFVLYSDVLIHEWTLLPQPSKGSLAGYFGGGLRYENKDKDDEFGFRAVGGVSYWIESHPIEVFLEVAPVFQVSPDTDTEFDAGIGLRYYFTVL